jgi:hypothetical protein
MFRTLAEGWNWTPEQVSSLTPTQLIRLSPQSGGSGGGPITFHFSQYNEIAAAWLKWNSEEALLARAERKFQKYLDSQ